MPPLLLLLLSHAQPSSASFNWGSGCDGGSGTFDVTLAEGAVATLGEIPKGKYDVRVFLSSATDVDVQLFDPGSAATAAAAGAGGGSKHAEGDAVIAWCDTAAAPGCNMGVLGAEEGAATAEYKGARIEYSGYGGTAGQPGREFIKVGGATPVALRMAAFAFEAGAARVTYEWSRSRSGCCSGAAACGGRFDVRVAKGGSAALGVIPRGKKDLRVALTAANDVDVQLFDVEDAAASGFPEGRAVVGYCDDGAPGCNAGALGNNDGGAEQATHKGLVYRYSGYDGEGGKAGHEWIEIAGVSNTRLLMKAFGYAAGNATVSYSYFELPPPGLPAEPLAEAPPSIDWRRAANSAAHRTAMFRGVPAGTLIARRGGAALEFIVRGAALLPDAALATLVATVPEWEEEEKAEEEKKKGEKEGGAAAGAAWATSEVLDRGVDGAARTAIVRLALAAHAPVGNYTLRVGVGAHALALRLIVLFNPYKGGAGGDGVYVSAAARREYVESEEGLIWQGTSDANTAHVWAFAQFDFAQLAVALRTALRRLPLRARADPVRVARHVTYAVGEDVCYGRWGGGHSYTSGTPAGGYRCSKTDGSRRCVEPGEWTGTAALFALHVAAGFRRVQYCQCFVYAGVVTTVGRALGIATRPVTNFQSAHDGEANRAIERYFAVDESSGAFAPVDGPSHDSVWSFHVWNEMHLRRPDLLAAGEARAHGWQAVDATPQELSPAGAGVVPSTKPVYALGPASVALVRRNLQTRCPGSLAAAAAAGAPPPHAPPSAAEAALELRHGCYDGGFVVAEVNAWVNMWVRDAAGTAQGGGWSPYGCAADGSDCGFPTDPFGDALGTIGLQVLLALTIVLSRSSLY